MAEGKGYVVSRNDRPFSFLMFIFNHKKQPGFLAGFTAIEFLFVITIIGILAAVVIPRVGRGGFYDKLRTYTTAHKIAGDMRLARRLAITTGDLTAVAFYREGGSSDLNRYVMLRMVGSAWEQVGIAKSIPDEIIVSGRENILFINNGSSIIYPDVPTAYSFNYNYRIGTYRYRVNVHRVTGRARLYSY